MHVCMYIRMHICMYIRMHVCMYVHIAFFVCVFLVCTQSSVVCMHACILFVCMHTSFVYVCDSCLCDHASYLPDTCTVLHAYTYIRACRHTYAYIHTYMHAHIHTYMQTSNQGLLLTKIFSERCDSLSARINTYVHT